MITENVTVSFGREHFELMYAKLYIYKSICFGHKYGRHLANVKPANQNSCQENSQKLFLFFQLNFMINNTLSNLVVTKDT